MEVFAARTVSGHHVLLRHVRERTVAASRVSIARAPIRGGDLPVWRLLHLAHDDHNPVAQWTTRKEMLHLALVRHGASGAGQHSPSKAERPVQDRSCDRT